MRRVTLPFLLVLLSCKAAQDAPCQQQGDCQSDLACLAGRCVDPKTYCRTDPAHAKRCTEEGRCSLVQNQCVASSEQECRESTRCQELGVCTYVGPCCSRDEVCPHEEEDPLTQVARLGDAATREAAIDKLALLVESTLQQDGRDANGPHAKALFEDIVPALNQLATSTQLSQASYAKLLGILAASRQQGAAAALVQAVSKYQVDDQQPTVMDAAMARVLGAIADLRLAAAREPVFRLFRQLRASWKKAQIEGLSNALGRAVLTLAAPEWEPETIALLEHPIDPHGDVQRWTDERYWQRIGARLLGRLGKEQAIEPLLRVVLSPEKSDIAPAATEALVRLGKPAALATEEVLDGRNQALLQQAAQAHQAAVTRDEGEAANRSAVDVRTTALATLLATIGRADGQEAVLRAAARVDAIGQGRIAASLVYLPATPERLEAFQKLFKGLPLDVPIDSRYSGVAALFVIAPLFFDASVTTWIIDQAVGLPGTDTALASLREPALAAALRLMTVEQLAEVDRLSQLITMEKFETDLATARGMLTRCKQDVSCYLDTLSQAGRKAEDSFEASKAAIMVGVYGTPQLKPKLAKLLITLRAPEARRLLALVLAHLSPQGDAPLAAELDKTLTAQALSDPEVSAAIGRLTARAQP